MISPPWYASIGQEQSPLSTGLMESLVSTTPILDYPRYCRCTFGVLAFSVISIKLPNRSYNSVWLRYSLEGNRSNWPVYRPPPTVFSDEQIPLCGPAVFWQLLSTSWHHENFFQSNRINPITMKCQPLLGHLQFTSPEFRGRISTGSLLVLWSLLLHAWEGYSFSKRYAISIFKHKVILVLLKIDSSWFCKKKVTRKWLHFHK